MNNWRKAFEITKLELHQSIYNILLAYLVTGLFIAMFVTQMPTYLDEGTALYDLLFLLVFGSSPLFPKLKSFETQHIAHQFIASPIVVMQNHLAIPHDTIVKSRLIIHGCYTFPAHLLGLIILYFFTPLVDMLSVGSFIAFSTIWLSLSIFIGYLVPRLSIGVRGFWVSNSGISIILLVCCMLLFLLIAMVHSFSSHGIVYWSIVFAKDLPILATCISIIIAILGYVLWITKMKKVLRKLNYS
ncbi:hypothetical protein [Paucisalibacillus sp. EB02]|uniref:hypothetical protein n=1 Tax=Paucisalibacillus sp. EB02 TaxID=1347087 RepID=UPI0004ADDF76|nr:hypothetical protein [Paucisalibacillus sp. EB02]